MALWCSAGHKGCRRTWAFNPTRPFHLDHRADQMKMLARQMVAVLSYRVAGTCGRSSGSPIVLRLPVRQASPAMGLLACRPRRAAQQGGPRIRLPFSSDPAFTRSWNTAEEASAYAADLANSMGLAGLFRRAAEPGQALNRAISRREPMRGRRCRRRRESDRPCARSSGGGVGRQPGHRSLDHPVVPTGLIQRRLRTLLAARVLTASMACRDQSRPPWLPVASRSS